MYNIVIIYLRILDLRKTRSVILCGESKRMRAVGSEVIFRTKWMHSLFLCVIVFYIFAYDKVIHDKSVLNIFIYRYLYVCTRNYSSKYLDLINSIADNIWMIINLTVVPIENIINTNVNLQNLFSINL